jgi:hypothetical protein
MRAPVAPGAGPGPVRSVGAKARRRPPGKRLEEGRPDPQVRLGELFFYEICSKTEERYSVFLFFLFFYLVLFLGIFFSWYRTLYKSAIFYKKIIWQTTINLCPYSIFFEI